MYSMSWTNSKRTSWTWFSRTDFKYPKDATNLGMFETVWFGTNGGMGGKGYGVMAPDDGMTVDELLKNNRLGQNKW